MATAGTLLRRLRSDRRTPARLLGVTASHLVRAVDQRQLPLFESDTTSTLETAHDRAVSRVVDAITAKFGRRSIHRAADVRRPREP